MMEEKDLIEKLSDYEHDRWGRWQKYLFSKCIVNSDGTLTIPKEFVDRWTILMNTKYNDLTEEEKLSDKKEAARILDIINKIETGKKKGIIVAGFGAIGKTTLGNKYDNIIDMESGYYQWDNRGFENIPYEQRKGTKLREKNKAWPHNYHQAVLDAREKYDIVLTSMHWHLLDFFEKNNIDYYLAYPTLDSEATLEKRCYERGNNKIFTDKLKINLYDWNEKIKDYHPKKILRISKSEFLEDVLKKNHMM